MIIRQKQHEQGTSFLQNAFFLSGTLASLIVVYQFILPHYAQQKTDNGQSSEQLVDDKVGNEINDIKTNNTKHSNDIKKDGVKVDNYTIYDGGMVVDDNSGLMWARCSVGEVWQGTACEGKAKAYTWDESLKLIKKLNQQNYLGYSDWRLPHIEDLHTLISCSIGFKETVKIVGKAGKKIEIESWCKGNNYQRPTINQKAFPNTQGDFSSFYWSSSSYDGSNRAWAVNFGYGYANDRNIEDSGFLRVVRIASVE